MSMSIKKLKETLLNKGYRLEKSSEVNMRTKITNEYYIQDDKCIRFLKIGKSREKIIIYTGWNKRIHNAGQEFKYNANIQDVEDFIMKKFHN